MALLSLLPAPAPAAEDVAAKSRELQQLHSRIESLQQELQTGQQQKTRAEKELQQVEREIGRLSQTLRGIGDELALNRRQLRQMQVQYRQQLQGLRDQRRQLAGEARAAYLMGRQQQVKLLLNQEDPAAVGRMLVYFNYLSRARGEQIAVLHDTLAELRRLEGAIEEKNARLDSLRRENEAESRRLVERKAARSELVARLSRQLQDQGGELRRLQDDERRLRRLVDSLQDMLADIPADGGQQPPFGTLRGKLDWPAQGRLARRFGSRRGSSGLKWQGVVIAAPEGGEVHAVAAGRVAFADWMRGFGLLVIIDHGDGYMSLYGHNQALYKEVGEWVDTGEVVATTGISGGQTQSGLYFEIRHKGRPVNPLRWCAGKPAVSPG